MSIKAIMFDFDGTVMDGSGCIMHALKKTCDRLGYTMPKPENLTGFIGPPIWVSMQRAGFNDSEIPAILDVYRKQCREAEAMMQFRFFDGIPEMLVRLREKGYRLAIVSMRTQGSLDDIADYHSYPEYFDVVYGRQGDNDTETKSELLTRVFDILNVKKEECIIVGDSEYDEEGARVTGIGFVAVTYGFGFKKAEDVKNSIKICSSVNELSKYLLAL